MLCFLTIKLLSFLYFTGVGAIAAILYLASQAGYKEISYKDFINTYLMDKSVERLEVVNKSGSKSS